MERFSYFTLALIIAQVKTTMLGRLIAERGGGENSPLPDPNKSILPTTENMPFLILCFKLQA